MAGPRAEMQAAGRGAGQANPPQILRATLENKVTRTSLEREGGGAAETGHHPRMESSWSVERSASCRTR